MRILHVIPQFPYFGGRTIVGGHATCLLTLAVAQHQAGEDVTILSYTQGRCGPHKIDDGPVAHSLFAHAKTRTIGYGLRFCRAAAKWAGRHRDEFDLVHVHSGFAGSSRPPDYRRSTRCIVRFHFTAAVGGCPAFTA
jgi:hypothetical protein